MKHLQLPNQVIPESQKGESWMKDNVDAIRNMSIGNSDSKRKDLECWFMYHNSFNENEFDYLTKISSGTEGESDYYLPAKVRHIPIQRSKLNVLISQQKHRPYQSSTVISNSEGKAEKFSRLIHGFVGAYSQELDKRVSSYNVHLSQLEQQRQQIQQVLQQEPQSEADAMQIAQIKQSLPVIEEQLRMARNIISKELAITEKDYRKMAGFYQYEKKDFLEDIAEKLMVKLRQDFNIKQKSLKNFISEVVTGKQNYYVDYNLEKKELVYETLNAMNVFYPVIDDVEWIQDSPWVMIERQRSMNQVIDIYGIKDPEEIKKLEDFSINKKTVTTYATSELGRSLMNDMIYSGSKGFDEGVTEQQVFWRSVKKIQVKKSPNPHDETQSFTHFLDDEDKIYQDGQLYWDKAKKKYVDKRNGNEYDKKDVILANKGEKLETRYIDEIYEGVVLAGCIYKNLRKRSIRLYSNEDYSWTCLPVFGKSFNSITDRPYSLVWDTKDLQKLYNILHWHRELLLATSGVKGTVMDMSQKPEGMSKKEWMYYKKLGTMWIETAKKHGRPSSYNQFGNFDDTLTPAVQYIDNMLAMIDDVMGNIIGVGRQRQGQVTGSDQVATYQMAIQQNSLITEIIYAQHDEIERRAQEALLNLAVKYKYVDGGMFDYKTDDMNVETFKIPSGVFDNVDFQINIANNTLNEQKLKELKQFAIKEYDKGLLPFKDMITLYDTETLTDMKKKFEQYTTEAYEVAQRNAENAANLELQKEERLMQAQAQIESQIKQSENQLKDMELKLKAQVEQMKIQMEQAKLQAQKEMHQVDSQIKMVELQSEYEVEQSYLQEQTRKNTTDERLRSIELQLNSLLKNSEIKTKSQEGMSKGSKAKEHISDR